MTNNRSGFAQFRGWQSLLITAGVLILLYFVAKAIFNVLYFLAIPLLIATAIIKHQVILNYFKTIGSLFKRSPWLGIGAGLLSAFFYPVVIGFLFFQAMMYRKVDKIQEDIDAQKESEYVEYEEISHEIDSENLLEDLNREKREAEENLDYWDLLNDDEPPKRKDLW
ncbi:MAG: hypothetical protein AB8G11_09230 [Saprospiraceae bacterium]